MKRSESILRSLPVESSYQIQFSSDVLNSLRERTVGVTSLTSTLENLVETSCMFHQDFHQPISLFFNSRPVREINFEDFLNKIPEKIERESDDPSYVFNRKGTSLFFLSHNFYLCYCTIRLDLFRYQRYTSKCPIKKLDFILIVFTQKTCSVVHI